MAPSHRGRTGVVRKDFKNGGKQQSGSGPKGTTLAGVEFRQVTDAVEKGTAGVRAVKNALGNLRSSADPSALSKDSGPASSVPQVAAGGVYPNAVLDSLSILNLSLEEMSGFLDSLDYSHENAAGRI